MTRRILVPFACVLALLAIPSLAAAQSSSMYPSGVASGDPRPSSVVLWTRVNPDLPTGNLRLEMASDPTFTDVVVTRSGLETDGSKDWCVKLRVDGLAPYTTYYYRFVAGSGAAEALSPIGRTRTAAAPDDPRPVRFAVVYCQDFVGRWYNAYAKLLRDHDDDLDFVVFLGDYIYETTGDPAFQDPTDERRVEFEDEAGAIPLGGGNLAAKSLSNYRDLYRIYRSDPMLQEVQARWPMIAIWDDHEFSDDSWGATATYFDGAVDETDVERKRDAERAYFEWMPIAAGLGSDDTLEVDDSMLYPNSRIYRDFRFGQYLELALTDYRSFRPDHLIPENAFPGAMALDEPALEALVGDAWPQLRDQFDPYIDFDAFGRLFPIFKHTATAVLATGLAQAAPGLSFEDAYAMARTQLSGDVSTGFLNRMYEAAGYPPPLPDAWTANLPRGLSYLYLGKTGFFTSTGSRYAVLHDPFQLLAGARWLATGGEAQNAFGGQQTSWLQGTLTQSRATWTVLGNSVMMTPLVVDFTNPAIAAQLPPTFPDLLKTRLDLNLDQFDGFPQKRLELETILGLVPNAVVISGDIHATFVTDHGDGLFEFTGPAVSSGTFQDLVARTVASDPVLGSIDGLDALLSQLAGLLQLSSLDDVRVSPSDILYARTDNHGYMTMEVMADQMVVRLVETPADNVFTSFYDDPPALDSIFSETAFVVSHGEIAPLP